MILKIKLLIFLIISISSIFKTSKAQPSIIDATLKENWCKSTIEVCESVCRSRNTVPAVDQCTGLNLLENCLCTDGYAPTLTNYENTVSYYLCEYNRPSGPCANTCYLGTPDCIKLNNNKSPSNIGKTKTATTPVNGGPNNTGGPAKGPNAGGPAKGPGGAPDDGAPNAAPPGDAPGGTPDAAPPGDAPGGAPGGAPPAAPPAGPGNIPGGKVPGPAGVPGGKVPSNESKTPPTPAKGGDGKIPTDGGTSPVNPSPTTNNPNNPSGNIPSEAQETNNKNVTIAIGVSATLLSIIIAIILVIWFRRKRNKTQSGGYFFDNITRNIGNAFSSNGDNSTSSEEKRISVLKAGLVKGNNSKTNSGNYSTESSNLAIRDQSNNEVIDFDNRRASCGIFITKTQSVSVQHDNDYFGTSSLSNLSSSNSFVSMDNTTKSRNRSSFTSNNTKSINSIENLNTNSTTNLTNLNNKYSSSDSGYLANSSNLNTSSEDDNIFSIITF